MTRVKIDHKKKHVWIGYNRNRDKIMEDYYLRYPDYTIHW